MENVFLGSDSVSFLLALVDINCSAPQLLSLLCRENEGAPIMELFGG